MITVNEKGVSAQTIPVGDGTRFPEVIVFEGWSSLVTCFRKDFSEVLLFRHGPASRFEEGIYGLPGGRVEKDKDGREETGEEAGARELREETGLSINVDKLEKLRGHTYYARGLSLKDGTKVPAKWRVYYAHDFHGDLQEETPEGKAEWVEVAKLGDYRFLSITRDIVLNVIKDKRRDGETNN